MSGSEALELVLFGTRAGEVDAALEAGIRAVIVDWEWRDKENRQRGSDTEINRDGPEDLERLRSLGVPRRVCRINHFGPWTHDEIEVAVAAGATLLMLPLAERAAEVGAVLSWARGRCQVGILVETVPGVEAAAELARLPVDRVYVGLNDLAISRRSPSLFDAVADGTVARLRETFRGHRFGFGGVTVVDGGSPVPCRLLLAEMARLDCAFSFLRRSFKRDVVGRDLGLEVARIEELWWRLRGRSPAEVACDREELLAVLEDRAGAVRA